MDSIGTLELGWAQGYDGSRVQFINRDTVCFKCGNTVRFIDEEGRDRVFLAPGNGIGALAAHTINKVFAVADIGIDPPVRIFQYPSYREIAVCENGAELEYAQMVFSASEFMATITGVPDHKLILWRYTDGTQLCSYELDTLPPTAVSFNPGNWRQLCLSTVKELSTWTIECRDDVFVMKKEKLLLPTEYAAVGSGVVEKKTLLDEDESFGRISTMTKLTIDLPVTSIAGVKGDSADKFAEYQETEPKVVPMSHVWTPQGDVLIGCQGGQLLRVDGEAFWVKVLVNPSFGRANSRIDSAKSRGSADLEDRSYAQLSFHGDNQAKLIPGSLNCMCLHKKGLYAGGEDGAVRLIEVTQNDVVKLISAHNLEKSVTTLAFNGTHHRLAIGTNCGAIYVADPNTYIFDPKCLLNIHCGPVVGVAMLSTEDREALVSVRKDGELQMWDSLSSKLISSLPLCYEATSIAASPLAPLVAVGTAPGYIFIMDYSQPDGPPRIVSRLHMHQGPVLRLVFNDNGRFLLSGSNDGHVFVIEGRPSENFKPLGHIAMVGEIDGLCTNLKEGITKVVVTARNKDSNAVAGANRLIHFELPNDLAVDVRLKHASLRCDFADDTIKKLAFNLSEPCCGLTVTGANIVYTLTKTKKLYSLALPDTAPKKETSKDSYLQPAQIAPGHQLPGGRVRMSPHHKWVGTIGTDGKIMIRTIGALDTPVEVNAHNYSNGGIADFVFNEDASAVYTAGYDGTVTCFNLVEIGKVKSRTAVEAAKRKHALLSREAEVEIQSLKTLPDWTHPPMPSRPVSGTEKMERDKLDKIQKIEASIQADNIYATPSPTCGADSTWLEERELEAHLEEDKKYANEKKDLRLSIRDIRRKLQKMMKENEAVPDIEKLAHHEFDLDVEEQKRLQAEGDAEVARIREEKEFENLAKQYLTELIKKECWLDMKIKGRGILAFNNPLEVNNYPMKQRSKEELGRLEMVHARRRVEIAEREDRNDVYEGREIQRDVEKHESKASGSAEEEVIDKEQEEENKKKAAATQGSLGAMYGGENELLYSQFDLHSREQKLNQIIMLEDAIYRIKTQFNKEFDTVYEKKEQEIAKIKDKNRRIKKILDDLDMKTDLFQPELGVLEKPEMLLSVEEEEVRVEKFLTPEQRKKRDEEKKAEEERRAKEKGDNWRERGLDNMMGGVLEVKKEDELKKDIPVPPFMTAKDETEWNDEEKKLAAEYEKKVKELNEEREKYRKQLEVELKKLQGLIQDGSEQFDETLRNLFMKKIRTEMVLYMEELKILRLKYSLLQEEELNNREDELNELLEFKKKIRGLSAETLSESKRHVDAFREAYDKLVAEDKVMDRGFKRDFHDVGAHLVDQLYKLFRRRPKGTKARGTETPIYDPSSGNPFFERPSTARQREQSQKAIDAALTELDKESNAPEGVETAVWERMCALRRQKMESELLVKSKALVMASMQDFLARRQAEDEKVREEIDQILEELNKLKDDRLRFTCNLEVQLLMKQGQVEVDMSMDTFIPDYTKSLLIHRSVVEDLNGRIRSLGESKIASMVESKDFRKGIVQLEWEHKRMTMEMEDLQNKMRDIQNQKVTREIQLFLTETDHETRSAKQIQILEQTLSLQKQQHEKNCNVKKKSLKELKKTITEKEVENSGLSKELEELNVTVNERRHIHDVNAKGRNDGGREEKYREIVQRRKLVDLAKAQAQEVAVLRAEVERLRMRTFPALVQVEH